MYEAAIEMLHLIFNYLIYNVLMQFALIFFQFKGTIRNVRSVTISLFVYAIFKYADRYFFFSFSQFPRAELLKLKY